MNRIAILQVFSLVLATQTNACGDVVLIPDLGSIGLTVVAEVSNNGIVVGSSDVDGSGGHSLVWTEQGGSVSLGRGRATGVTAFSRKVVGVFNRGSAFSSFAYISNEDGSSSRFLPAPPNSDPNGVVEARGVSSDGRYVAGIFETVDNQQQVGTWDLSSETFNVIPTSQSTDIFGISGNGEFLAGSANGEPIRLNGSGQVDNLHAPGVTGIAKAVSHAGTWVVGYTFGENNILEAYRWSDLNGVSEIETLFPGGDTKAFDVTDNGRFVVGSSATQDGSQARGFIWDPVMGTKDIHDFLIENFNVDPAGDGWNLYEVSTISKDGRYIAGRGVRNGRGQAWFFDTAVPEPSAAFVLLGLLFLRRR